MEPVPTPLSEPVLLCPFELRRKTAPKVLVKYHNCGTSGHDFNNLAVWQSWHHLSN